MAVAVMCVANGGLLSCHDHPPSQGPVAPRGGASKGAAVPGVGKTLTIIGVNDMHGAIDRLPLLGGYVEHLRAARRADHGAVLFVDAGDIFQGTLESNLREGQAMIEAYNVMGVDAATLGNHEFDFGPVGPKVTASDPGDDPRGAIKARTASAKFPFVSANLVDKASGKPVTWPGLSPTVMVERGGIKIGIIGIATESTPYTTMPANVADLAIAEPAATIVAQAADLRAQGATVLVVLAHMGSACADLHDAHADASCDASGELVKVVRALPPGVVDVIVGGHTHAGMAHRINDIAVIESFASGAAFGRVDVRVVGDKVTGTKIFPPQQMCGERPQDAGKPTCTSGWYEGAPVAEVPAIAAVIDPAQRAAKALRDQRLEVSLSAPFTRSYAKESALGNLFADLMLAMAPKANVALTNGGGLRADMPAGVLTYGSLYEANPFDNRLTMVAMTGAQLKKLVRNNVTRDGGIYVWAGFTAEVACREGELSLTMRWPSGKLVGDGDAVRVATSDFLASGGVIGRLGLPPQQIVVTDHIIREEMASELKRRGGALAPGDFFDPKKPRVILPMARPVRCGAAQLEQGNDHEE